MKVSCTHFQCAAGAFTYLRDHFPHSYSVDMSHQILSLNINLMLVGTGLCRSQGTGDTGVASCTCQGQLLLDWERVVWGLGVLWARGDPSRRGKEVWGGSEEEEGRLWPSLGAGGDFA